MRRVIGAVAVLALAGLAACGTTKKVDSATTEATTASTAASSVTASSAGDSTTTEVDAGGLTTPVTHARTTVAADSSGSSIPNYGTGEWATGATATSNYGTNKGDSWNASQATGKADVPACADDGRAWASKLGTSLDTIALTYAKPLLPKAVVVVESYSVGQVTSVVVSGVGHSKTVYQADPTGVAGKTCPFGLRIDTSSVDFPVNEVAITVDQTKLGTWNEIDGALLVPR